MVNPKLIADEYKNRTKKLELQQKTLEQNMLEMITLLDEVRSIRDDVTNKTAIVNVQVTEVLKKKNEDPVIIDEPVKGYDLSSSTTKDVLQYWKYACNKYSDVIENRKVNYKTSSIINLGKITYQEIRNRGIEFNLEHMNVGSRRLYNVVTEELGIWNTKYVNTLPDSSFAYISPGGEKDDEGNTIPRTLRHLPYKDGEGKVDVTHVRNALARLTQTHISDEEKKQAFEKLKSAAESVDVKVSKD